jgi:hypothetical protein
MGHPECVIGYELAQLGLGDLGDVGFHEAVF